MIWAFLLIVLIGLVATVAALVTSRLRYDPMADPVGTTPDPGLPDPPHARDVDGVRFDRALRGYRPDQVDVVLDALRDQLAAQESELTTLRRLPYAVAAPSESVDVDEPTPRDQA